MLAGAARRRQRLQLRRRRDGGLVGKEAEGEVQLPQAAARRRHKHGVPPGGAPTKGLHAHSMRRGKAQKLQRELIAVQGICQLRRQADVPRQGVCKGRGGGRQCCHVAHPHSRPIPAARLPPVAARAAQAGPAGRAEGAGLEGAGGLSLLAAGHGAASEQRLCITLHRRQHKAGAVLGWTTAAQYPSPSCSNSFIC